MAERRKEKPLDQQHVPEPSEGQQTGLSPSRAREADAALCLQSGRNSCGSRGSAQRDPALALTRGLCCPVLLPSASSWSLLTASREKDKPFSWDTRQTKTAESETGVDRSTRSTRLDVTDTSHRQTRLLLVLVLDGLYRWGDALTCTCTASEVQLRARTRTVKVASAALMVTVCGPFASMCSAGGQLSVCAPSVPRPPFTHFFPAALWSCDQRRHKRNKVFSRVNE